MRVQMVGTLAPKADNVPELRSLFDRPAVDAAAWTGLPANTAIALICHDASTVWLWLNDILDFPTGSLDLLRETLGLDLEADLLSADGPLVDHFALAITPPLPDQPISQGLAAAQLLFLARGATRAQVEGVRTAMEGRGATFGSQEVEGVPLQILVGTAPTGYAISYGFDGDLFLFGSSPGVVAWSVIANREGQGLVETEPFRTVLDTLPDEPVFVAYLNRPSLTETVRANLIEEHYQGSQEFLILEPFEAIGLGLRFQPDRLDGVIYFLIE